MIQISIYEAEKKFEQLIELLEEKKEDSIILTRNEKPVACIELVNQRDTSKRIGVAKGKLFISEEFYKLDSEIEKLFEESTASNS